MVPSLLVLDRSAGFGEGVIAPLNWKDFGKDCEKDLD